MKEGISRVIELTFVPPKEKAASQEMPLWIGYIEERQGTSVKNCLTAQSCPSTYIQPDQPFT